MGQNPLSSYTSYTCRVNTAQSSLWPAITTSVLTQVIRQPELLRFYHFDKENIIHSTLEYLRISFFQLTHSSNDTSLVRFINPAWYHQALGASNNFHTGRDPRCSPPKHLESTKAPIVRCRHLNHRKICDTMNKCALLC